MAKRELSDYYCTISQAHSLLLVSVLFFFAFILFSALEFAFLSRSFESNGRVGRGGCYDGRARSVPVGGISPTCWD